MPQHKQFKKNMRKIEKASLRNHAAKSRLNTMIKKIRAAATKEEAHKALIMVVPVIDSNARKGIIKKQTASRKKSRLTKYVANMA
ncbi:30S ribosomal protein S20 [Candidatus Latescibacterota bacterium]